MFTFHELRDLIDQLYPCRTVEPLQRVVRISRTGNVMATGGTDGHVRLWHFPQMTQMHDLEAHSKEIDDIDFCSKGKQMATVAKDGKLVIWNVTNGTKIKELTWSPSSGAKSVFKRCRYRPTVADAPPSSPQQFLFTLSNSLLTHGFLQLWNVELGQVDKLITYTETLSELAVSDDGKFVAVGTMSGTVDMFIAFSLQRVLHVPGAHEIFVTSLEFLPTLLDGPAITSNAEAAVLSCSADNKICIHSIPYRREFWLRVLCRNSISNIYF